MVKFIKSLSFLLFITIAILITSRETRHNAGSKYPGMGGVVFRRKRNAMAEAAGAAYRPEGWPSTDSTEDRGAVRKQGGRWRSALKADVGGLEHGRLEGNQVWILETDRPLNLETHRNSSPGFGLPVELSRIFETVFEEGHAAFSSELYGW